MELYLYVVVGPTTEEDLLNNGITIWYLNSDYPIKFQWRSHVTCPFYTNLTNEEMHSRVKIVADFDNCF